MSGELLPPGAAIMALTRTGLGLAQRLKKILPGARTYGRAGRVDDADETFAETTQHLRHLFAERRPIVAICATGIVIRALAPAIPDRVTAGWNNLLCSLTTGMDDAKGEKYVDIFFMGFKGGSGGMNGTDGYDHIGMIDASAIRRFLIS